VGDRVTGTGNLRTSGGDLKGFVDRVFDEASLVNEELEVRLRRAFLSVQREPFIHASLHRYAFRDVSLPIGYGRFLLKPSMFVRMLGVTGAGKGHTVLELGPGSCYGSAVMSELGMHVYSLEPHGGLSRQGRKLLDTLDYMKILLRSGPLNKGWSEHAPFDYIIASTVLPEVPRRVVEQLSKDGLFVGLIGDEDEQQLIVAQNAGDEMTITSLGHCSVYPIRG